MANRGSVPFAAIAAVAFLSAAASLRAGDAAKPAKPNTAGRPVFYVDGNIVVFPEGVEEPAADHKGSIGKRPLALISIDGKVVGEVYYAALKESAASEAKSMAASADNGDQIKLHAKTTIKHKEKEIEVVTLKMNVKSNVGTPWMIHSLYIPRDDACVTFKLAVSEERFAATLPYLETMLFFDGKGAEGK